MSVAVDWTVDQIVDALSHLNESDAQRLIETLEQQNLLARWEQVKQEAAAGRLLTEEELLRGDFYEALRRRVGMW